MMNKIHYLLDKNENKLLPFQYYNKFNLISLPADGKRVLIPNWPNKDHTVVPEYINLNTCLLTGESNNLTILDFDITDNGMEYYKEFKEVKTTTVLTSSGGVHLYFKYNPNIPSMNRLIDENGNKIGIDIKNDKSIVIAPPSKINDKLYKFKKGRSFNDIRPIKMPKWIENFILDHIKESTKKRLK
jgi:hypothetical protein